MDEVRKKKLLDLASRVKQSQVLFREILDDLRIADDLISDSDWEKLARGGRALDRIAMLADRAAQSRI